MNIARGVNLIFLNTDAAAVNLGERIALLRDRQKMSQNELAERIKTSQNTIPLDKVLVRGQGTACQIKGKSI